MTQLLVSVRDAAEARAALAGGAAWIDVKEPRGGSLGAAAASVLCAVRDTVAGRVPLSAAAGELVEGVPPGWWSSLAGYSLCKVGLSRCRELADWPQRWVDFVAQRPPAASVVAVAYADYRTSAAPEPLHIVEQAARCGWNWLLVDNWDKSRGSVFHHLSDADLGEIFAAARRAGMSVALAGSLTRPLLARAVSCGPDLLAVRNAVCRDGRTGRVDAALVRQIRDALSTTPSTTAADALLPAD